MKPEPANADRHAQTRQKLLDLAEDASLYLRRSAEPSVRVAAALLLSASLAACVPPPFPTLPPAAPAAPPAVPPLSQEVKDGLPTSPGTYPVSPSSLTRDPQGVYGFTWRNPTGAATWNQGRASLVKLAQGTEDTLEVPASGDPVLRLKPDTPINLPDDDTPIGPTPTPRTSTSSTSSSSSSSGNRSIAWYPFPVGGGTSTAPSSTTATDTVAPTTPAYRNPPAADPGQGSVRGASSSLAAPTSSARTWTSPSRSAATGQAGGPGSGTAASSRSGSSSTAQGASRPGSSGFSGGKSGSSSGSSSSSSG